MKRIYLIGLIIILSTLSIASSPIPKYNPVHYFVVMGQSNAVTNSSFGLGPGFIQEMKKLGYNNVELIPTAVGGTGILEWQKNSDPNSLYGSAILKIKKANETGQIDGIIFFQGENETKSQFAYVWSELFLRLVDDLRKDLKDPNLPIVYAQIACKSPGEVIPYCDVVQKEQESIKKDNITMIVSSDIPYRSNDPFHLTNPGYTRIGIRFAREMNILLKGE